MNQQRVFLLLIMSFSFLLSNSKELKSCESLLESESEVYVSCHPAVEQSLAAICDTTNTKRYQSYELYLSNYDSLWGSWCAELDLPHAFCFLPLALTEMNNRYSTSFKRGAWALTPIVAMRYGLRIDRYYDERSNLHLSTKAALKYISDLYRYYNHDFWLTVLAYANSAAQVHDALLIYDTKPDVWTLYGNSLLSCQEVIPTLMSYILLSHTQHCQTHYSPTPLIEIKDSVNIDLLCKEMHWQRALFFEANQTLSKESSLLLPGYRCQIPTSDIVKYRTCEHRISEATQKLINQQQQVKQIQQETIHKEQEKQKALDQQAIVYRVKSGDTLGHIAIRYKVTVSELKKWNHLKSDILQIGQRIKIIRH